MDEGVLKKVCKFLKKQPENEALFSVFWEGTKDFYPDGLSKTKLRAWLKEHLDRFEIIANKNGDPFGKIKLKDQASGVVLPAITKAEDDQITQKLIEFIDNKEENGHLFAIICKNKAKIFPEKLQDKKYIRKWLVEHENYFKMVNDVHGGLYSVEVKAEARNIGTRRRSFQPSLLPPPLLPNSASFRPHPLLPPHYYLRTGRLPPERPPCFLFAPAAGSDKTSQSKTIPPKTGSTDSRAHLLKMADNLELRVPQAIQKNDGTIPFDGHVTGIVLPTITKAEDDLITQKLIQCIDNEENGHLFAIICKNKVQIFPEKLQDKKYVRKWLLEHENYFKVVKEVSGGPHSVEVKPEARSVGKFRPLPRADSRGKTRPSKTENTESRGDLLKMADDMEMRISQAIQKQGGTMPFGTLLKANDVIYPLTDEESLRVFLSHFAKFEIINIEGIGEWVHLKNVSENEAVSKVISFIFKNGGTVPFGELQNQAARLIGGFINTSDALLAWLKTKASDFEIVPKSDDPKKAGQVKVNLGFSPRFCHNYVANGQCEKKRCQFLHICKAYVCQPQHKNEACEMSHDIRDAHNKLIVDKMGALSKESDNVVVDVLRKSYFPRVCSEYNKGGKCPREGKCHFLHICGNYVLNQCSGCNLSHNVTDGLHNIDLLKKYSMLPSKNMNLEIVKSNIAYAQVKKTEPDQKVEVKRKKNRPRRRKKKSDQASSTVDDASSAETDSDAGDFDNNSFASSTQKGTPSLLSSDNIQKSRLAASLSGFEKVEHWMGTRGRSYQSQSPTEAWDKESDSASVSSDVSVQSSVSSVQSLWQDALQKKVFITILEKYDGNAPFNKISKEKDLFDRVDDVVKWFEKHSKKFILHRNGQGKIDTVSSFSSKARICLDYSQKRGCSKPTCGFFHICRDHVEDCCVKGDKCPLNHDVKSEQVSQVAKRVGLQDLSPSQLLTLVCVSVPSVCHYHNQGGCNRGVFCPNLHVCKAFAKGNRCKANESCKYGHKQALKQEPAKKILRLYYLDSSKELNDKKLKYIQRMIFVFDTRKQHNRGRRKSVGEQPEAQDKTEVTDEPKKLSGLMDADLTETVDSPAQEPADDIVPSICHKFLTGKCRQRKKCSDVHFGLPYCWQFKLADSIGSKWENFDTADCENIEKYFCDEKCNAAELSISTKITEDMLSIRLDFQSMSGHRQASTESGFKIRRLECKGSGQNENEAWCQTKWMWYKFESSRWIQCEANKVKVYEVAFLDGMLQVDWSTLRRRPSSFLTESQVVEKKRETKEQQMSEETATPTLSRSVSNDPSQPEPDMSMENTSSAVEPGHCYRTRVEHGAPDYKTVENLCNFSDQTGVIVNRIEKIRSDVLSNKYVSKRKSINDKLLPGELPNERYLFVPCLNDDIQRIMNGNIGESRIILPRPFGRGHYFTSDASLCLRWCREHTTSYSQYSLIVCQVLLGASTQGTSGLTELPRQPDGRFYDSLVDTMDNPTVFMVGYVDQCYPTFIIDFSCTPAPANEVENVEIVDRGLTAQPQHTYPSVTQALPTYHRESPRAHSGTHPLSTSYATQSANEFSVVPQRAPTTPNIPSSPVDYVKAPPQPPAYSERSDPPPAYTPYPQTTRTGQVAEVPRSRNVRQTPRQFGDVKDDKCSVM